MQKNEGALQPASAAQEAGGQPSRLRAYLRPAPGPPAQAQGRASGPRGARPLEAPHPGAALQPGRQSKATETSLPPSSLSSSPPSGARPAGASSVERAATAAASVGPALLHKGCQGCEGKRGEEDEPALGPWPMQQGGSTREPGERAPQAAEAEQSRC